MAVTASPLVATQAPPGGLRSGVRPRARNRARNDVRTVAVNVCECQPRGLPCPDSGECLLCSKSSRPEPREPTHVTIPVSEWDALLTYRRRVGYAARAN